jgi:serine/threonine protein kinase
LSTSSFIFELLVDEEEEVLGRGAFGDALLCMHKVKQIRCVVKKMPKIKIAKVVPESAQTVQWKHEVAAMAAISSDYIVKIFDAFEEKNYQYIVMEYCENGNLRDFLMTRESAGRPLSEQVRVTSDISPHLIFLWF